MTATWAEIKENRTRLKEQYGSDIYSDGCILRYYRQFNERSEVYPYAAVKGNNKWYISTGEQLSWEQFLLEVERENILPKEGLLEFASEFVTHDDLRQQVEED